MNFEVDGFVQEGYKRGRWFCTYRILDIRM